MKFVELMRALAGRTNRAHGAGAEEPARRTLAAVSMQLAGIAAGLEAAVEEEASGRVHGRSLGRLEYPLQDGGGAPLHTSWSDPDHVARRDIEASDGYRELARRVEALGLSMQFVEEDVDPGDEDSRDSYTVVISGWRA